MTYLLKFRALCFDCEKAEASLWCIQDQCALCRVCDEKVHSGNRISQRHERVEVVKSSVLSTLCNECNMVPASFYHQGRDSTLCELCVQQERDSTMQTKDLGEMYPKLCFGSQNIIPLQDAHVTDSIVFDKMDFTTSYAEKKRKSRTRLILAGLGSQESPESKVDRWLNNKTYTPAWSLAKSNDGHAESKLAPSNLAALVSAEVLSGSKRKLPSETKNSLKGGGDGI
ncbi:hypothetical protein NDN08_001872 [Rhodosorus marinus]|uniref:B box-type domain-containing protein n=1 Tax=Rhodosorus marinus TaxID=101924 RepID=A0AAV8US24_9RHOD|nr:hypothetical protein NDN08_001872 [Rhodosorus marinus]